MQQHLQHQHQQPQIQNQTLKLSKYEKDENKNSKKSPSGKKAFTKDDISAPQNYIHLAHVGMNGSFIGSANQEKLDSWNTYLERFVPKNELRDPKTQEFIRGFLDHHGNNFHQPERNVNKFNYILFQISGSEARNMLNF